MPEPLPGELVVLDQMSLQDRPRYDPFSLCALPAFWRGAEAVRHGEHGDAHGRLLRMENIAAEGRKDVRSTEDFRLWLAGGDDERWRR